MDNLKLNKKALCTYLEELSNLTNVEVKASYLSSNETFDNIRNAKIDKRYSFKNRMLFNNKKCISALFDKLSNLSKCEKIYLLTARSSEFGAFEIAGLSDFNTNFKFHDEPEGIISFVSDNLENEMILDYWNEDGVQWIDVEINGRDWVLIAELSDLPTRCRE